MDNNSKNDTPSLSPEEIRAIGEIQIGPSKYESFLDDHYKKFILGLVAVILLGVGGVAWYSTKNATSDKAAAELIAAMGENKIRLVSESSSSDQSKLQNIAQQYENTASAETALCLKGTAQLSGESSSEGITTLTALSESAQNLLVRQRATASLAMHYMNAGEKEKAILMWKKLCVEDAGIYAAMAYMCLGDIARMDGNTEEARSFYKSAIGKYPQSSLVREGGDIMLRLALLDVDDPKPVAPPVLPNSNSDNVPSLAPSIGNPVTK